MRELLALTLAALPALVWAQEDEVYEEVPIGDAAGAPAEADFDQLMQRNAPSAAPPVALDAVEAFGPGPAIAPEVVGGSALPLSYVGKKFIFMQK